MIFFVLFCFFPNLTNHLKTSPNSSLSVNSLKCVTITLSQKNSLFLLYSHSFTTLRTLLTPSMWVLSPYYAILCFPGSSVSKESSCNAGDPCSTPALGRSHGEGIGYPLLYSWASLVAHMVKNPPAVRETWLWYLGWEDSLEKGTATHSSILPWRIPCTEEPGRL